MKALNRQKDFDRWLRRILFSEKRVISSIRIRHITANGKTGQLIREIDGETIEKKDLELIMNEIQTTCEIDANGLNGVQRYQMEACTEDSDVIGRYVHRVEALRDFDGEDDIDTESPTKAGQTMQAMRHSEIFARIGSNAAIALLDRAIRSNIAQQDTIDKLITKNERMAESYFEKMTNAIVMFEELYTKKHEREVELKRIEIGDKIKMEALTEVKNIIPVVIRKLSGKTESNVRKSSEFVLLRRVLNGLTHEQISTMLDKFSPSQRIAFGDLYELMREDMKQEGPEESDGEKKE